MASEYPKYKVPILNLQVSDTVMFGLRQSFILMRLFSLISSYFFISGIGGGSILGKDSVDINKEVFILAVVAVVDFFHKVTLQSAPHWVI